MKTKALKKRLALKKTTIVNLGETEIGEVYGGQTNASYPFDCTTTLFDTVCLICFRLTEPPEVCMTNNTV